MKPESLLQLFQDFIGEMKKYADQAAASVVKAEEAAQRCGEILQDLREEKQQGRSGG